MSVSELINKNNWNKIFSLIKNNKIDLLKEVNSNKTVLELAAANNRGDILTYALQKNPKTVEKTFSDGETCIHILAANSYYDLLKTCLKKHPHFANIVNKDDESVVHLLYENGKMLRWIHDNVKGANFNLVNKKQETPLIKNISKTQEAGDVYDQNIQFLLNEVGVDLEVPKRSPPLSYAINKQKKYVVESLVRKGADVNSKDANYLTPLLLAIYHRQGDTVKLLLKEGAEIDYAGAEGDQNPLNLAILRKDYDIINLLIEHGFNVDSNDRNLETPLHYLLRGRKGVPADIMAKFLFMGDVNFQNTDGVTPLHLLFKNYNWSNFNKILEEKKLDVFVKDKDGRMPLQYINNLDLGNFFDMVVSSYFKHLGTDDGNNKNNMGAKITQIPECRDGFNTHLCRQHVMNRMISSKRSYASTPYEDKEKDVKLVVAPYAKHGLFNSDVLHSMIYTVEFLKKYKNVGVPFQYFVEDKVVNDKMLQTHNDLFREPEEVIIADIIKIYTDTFYELTPYIIVWRSATQYYVNKELGFHIQKCLAADRVRIIFVKLTLISGVQGTHANIILFDKKTGVLERFEPYGYVPYVSSRELDAFLEGYFSRCLGAAFRKYVGPEALMGSVGFQTISGDGEYSVKKLGDPGGYCLAWTFWYLEMRVVNLDVEPQRLIKKAVESVINQYGGRFLEFIRNYAGKLDRMKNRFLLEAGVDEKNVYNIVLPPNDYNKLVRKLVKDFYAVCV